MKKKDFILALRILKMEAPVPPWQDTVTVQNAVQADEGADHAEEGGEHTQRQEKYWHP